ncbi:MAG: GlsB/YeaQ/YmgE family stress response membrane protein [Saprospiraceae bacterium]|nr:GlsB/YeaQ/YmgE family stress response membrane protein [Saprospiraceae bacterium]
MGIIIWLLIGLAAGAVAKKLTPQEEKRGWVSSLITGIAGALLGGFIFGLVGIQSTSLAGSFIFALIGSVLFLFIYHRYIKDKVDLGI